MTLNINDEFAKVCPHIEIEFESKHGGKTFKDLFQMGAVIRKLRVSKN